MSFEEIKHILSDRFKEDNFITVNQKSNLPILQVPEKMLIDICQFLNEDKRLFFDYLACLTAIDNGPEKGTMEVIYNLTSIPYEHNLAIKVIIPRQSTDAHPTLPTISSIWRTADWHEREAFDLVGIHFEGHADLRRILLPKDWQGHPLQKDYIEQDFYHGIKVTY
ncbi:MAG: NADH-quinone oxidoreductase subunit C [Spirosomataceae bacterium]